jgi:tetratricopeptide (TPR) repeat protein
LILLPLLLMLLSARPSFAQGVPDSLEVAQASLKHGDYARAESQFRTWLDVNPNSPEVLDDLGIAQHLQGKSLDAIRTFQQVLRLRRYPDALTLLAVNYCKTEQYKLAVPLLNEAKAFWDEPNVMSTLGPCYLEANRPLDAVQLYEELIKRGGQPQDENAANLVRAWFDASRQLLDALGGLPSGRSYLHAIKQALNNPTLDAKSEFAKAFREAPYLRPGMSMGELMAQYELHPQEPALLYILGIRCAERASEDFALAQEAWPDSVLVLRLSAEMKASREDLDGAIADYEKLLTVFPDAPSSVHYALGNMYAGRLKWEKALDQYRLAQIGDPRNFVTMRRISECLKHLGQIEARREMLRTLAQEPDAPFWALRDFGEIEQSAEHLTSAVTYLNRASVLQPDDASVHYRLGRLYARLSQPELAAKELATFQQLNQNR